MKMSDVASKLGLSARNVTTLIDALESGDFVKRVPHPNDRRATLIELTSNGTELMEATLEDSVRQFAQVFSILSNDEAQSFLAIINKLNAQIDKVG